MKNKNTKKNASATMYMIFFFLMFLAFSAFAVDGALVLTNRVKLQNATEAAALAAAAAFDSPASVSGVATNTFNILKLDFLKSATSVVEVNTDTKQVKLTTEYLSKPIFLAFLGVTGIKLEAKACAMSESVDVNAQYSGVNWVSTNAEYSSNILPKDSSLAFPLTGFKSASFYYSGATAEPKFSLIQANGLSLGPGGYVTIKLPEPIIDKVGDDLYIEEGGSAKDGYMVFAGLDVNPDNPYFEKGKEGDDVDWVNISCSGMSKTIGSPIENVGTDGLGSQDKFYGSGSFNLGDACTGKLSMAKYIRIVDDNEETAYVGTTKYTFPGEASTATAGADIAPVTVLNHVRLIQSADYVSPSP